MTTWRVILKSGVAAMALLVVTPSQSGMAARPFPSGIRSVPIRPRNVFLDNGSLQPGLPGGISTLPLFLRNGGHFGFGSGGFQQHQLTNPQSTLMPTGSMGMGGKGGGGLNGISGGGY